MGCCFSRKTDDDENETNKSQITQTSYESCASFGPRNWFYKSKDQDMRFYILADSVRAKRHRSLGHNMVHNYNDDNFQVDVKLLTNGDLRVDLIRKGDDHDADVNLKVSLIKVDAKLEAMETDTRENTTNKDFKKASVTFPIVKLCSEIPQISFFVVVVSIYVEDKVVVETSSNKFNKTDHDTIMAWRGDGDIVPGASPAPEAAPAVAAEASPAPVAAPADQATPADEDAPADEAAPVTEAEPAEAAPAPGATPAPAALKNNV